MCEYNLGVCYVVREKCAECARCGGGGVCAVGQSCGSSRRGELRGRVELSALAAAILELVVTQTRWFLVTAAARWRRFPVWLVGGRSSGCDWCRVSVAWLLAGNQHSDIGRRERWVGF